MFDRDSHALFFAAGPPNAISCETLWELWPNTINLTAFLAVACTHMVWVLLYMTRTGFYRPIQWCYLFHSILAISHGIRPTFKNKQLSGDYDGLTCLLYSNNRDMSKIVCGPTPGEGDPVQGLWVSAQPAPQLYPGHISTDNGWISEMNIWLYSAH